jgi:hypothetical protein
MKVVELDHWLQNLGELFPAFFILYFLNTFIKELALLFKKKINFIKKKKDKPRKQNFYTSEISGLLSCQTMQPLQKEFYFLLEIQKQSVFLQQWECHPSLSSSEFHSLENVISKCLEREANW